MNCHPLLYCLRWYDSSAHLVNCAFDQTRYAADHFIMQFRSIWRIAQYFGQSRSALVIRLGLRLGLGLGARLGLGYWVSFRVRIRLWLGLGLRSWPNAQHVWSNKCAARLTKILRNSSDAAKLHDKVISGAACLVKRAIDQMYARVIPSEAIHSRGWQFIVGKLNF